MEERLKSRPFPQNTTGDILLKDLWTKYREEMLSNVGISIFIFGNKIDPKTGDTVSANGMVEEFDIAIKSGTIPIPVGATGFTANDLWKKVMDDFDKYVGIDIVKPMYQGLGDTDKSDVELIELVINIINEITKH